VNGFLFLDDDDSELRLGFMGSSLTAILMLYILIKSSLVKMNIPPACTCSGLWLVGSWLLIAYIYYICV
jgi:hypothetical protein